MQEHEKPVQGNSHMPAVCMHVKLVDENMETKITQNPTLILLCFSFCHYVRRVLKLRMAHDATRKKKWFDSIELLCIESVVAETWSSVFCFSLVCFVHGADVLICSISLHVSDKVVYSMAWHRFEPNQNYGSKGNVVLGIEPHYMPLWFAFHTHYGWSEDISNGPRQTKHAYLIRSDRTGTTSKRPSSDGRGFRWPSSLI
jgi:hypothetical protein